MLLHEGKKFEVDILKFVLFCGLSISENTDAVCSPHIVARLPSGGV